MAKTVAARPQDQKEQTNTTVVPAGAGSMPAELMDEARQYAGAGVSTSADDNTVPFLAMLQDNSPEIKPRDPKYLQGAVAGCSLLRGLNKLYTPDSPPLVQPCAFQRAVVEWIPRDDGGGFVARYEHTKDTIEETMKFVGGQQVPDPRDSKGRKMIWRTDRGTDLIDTRYHYVNILEDQGQLRPVVIAFSNTGHKSSREWMTLMKDVKIPIDGRLVPAPSWFKQYLLLSRERSNTLGSWFVYQAEDNGWITDKMIREYGRELYESVTAGRMVAAQDEDLSGAAPGTIDDDSGV